VALVQLHRGLADDAVDHAAAPRRGACVVGPATRRGRDGGAMQHQGSSFHGSAGWVRLWVRLRGPECSTSSDELRLLTRQG
jgi:hypothetical protein